MARRSEEKDVGAVTVSSEAVKRSTWIGIIICALFGVLLLRILLIQTVNFKQYQNKVLNQITTESPVPADRGKIYDRNGNVLATNITTYRVFISPSGIKSAQEEVEDGDSTDYRKLVSEGLADLLDVNAQEVSRQITEYSKYLDRTIKRKVDEKTADRVREFINEHELQGMIYLEAQSTRYYPGGKLGAHMIGFTSTDGVGLYGLEYQYDEYLSGVDGYYILARDSHGKEMPLEYASYIEAVNGYHLHTTTDTTIQSFLEEQLALTVEKHQAANRACGIVMDVETGAILAMATSSPFDLNDPWMLDDLSKFTLTNSGYEEGSDEYAELQKLLLTEMWSNKAVTESYIPGSTFKIITSAMALEEQRERMPATVNCPGHKTISGHVIHCHKLQGHGNITFAEGLQQSCNVWFMTLGELVGIDTYQQYVRAFGYREATGIDLPGEGSSIFASEMSQLDLAIYAFGQNFNVTPLQQLCAISAVANGGKLTSPYLVEKITDDAGNIIYQHKNETKRQVVSEEVCKTLAEILEDGVSGNGGAKNAYVAGYRVAAKTGTSEKKGAEFLEREAYICSTVAFAPADDPQVAIIIIVDEPTKGVLYGSSVAAPYIAGALENILPYLGIDPIYTEAEQNKRSVYVNNYRGDTVQEAVNAIRAAGLDYEIIGTVTDPEMTVTAQSPRAGYRVEKESGKIYLYVTADPEQETVTVPDVRGMNAVQANAKLVGCKLNVRIVGSSESISGTGSTVTDQSVAPGSKVAVGSVITLTFGSDPDYIEND